MAEGERNSGVQGDLERELTCSVSRCSFWEVGVAGEGGENATGRNVTTEGREGYFREEGTNRHVGNARCALLVV